MNKDPPLNLEGTRGKAEHHVRDQIVIAANAHFSQFGFAKTTVSELAKSIGYSKAYIYKFFDSKEAIGEAICAKCLSEIVASAEEAVSGKGTAAERYRRMFGAIVSSSKKLFFDDRKLHDIATYAVAEKWQSTIDYQARLAGLVTRLVKEGRAGGEFERKTPIDEVTRAVLMAMQGFVNPVMIQHNLERLDKAEAEVCNLILRSLSP